MTLLLDLPTEILLQILDFIDCEASLYHVAQVNRSLFEPSITCLYRLNQDTSIIHGRPNQDRWARKICKHHREDAGYDEDDDSSDSSSSSSDYQTHINEDSDDDGNDDSETFSHDALRPHYYMIEQIIEDPDRASVWAVAQNRLETLQRAQSCGISMNQYHLIHSAATLGNLPIFMWLWHQDPENARLHSYRLLIHACRNGRLNIAEMLYDLKVRLPKEPVECLREACDANQYKLFHFLVHKGILDKLSKRSLGVCLLNGIQNGMVASLAIYLLESGASLNVSNRQGKFAFDYVIEDGDLELLDHFAHHGVQINDPIAPARLAGAAEREQEATALWLIEHGADVNLADINEVTPLEYAMEGRLTTVVESLIENGAYINASFSNGDTILIAAIKQLNFRLMQTLLEYGADPNGIHTNSNTPLIYACKWAEVVEDVVHILIKWGADGNILGRHGRGAVHVAAEKFQEEAIMALFSHMGPDINLATVERHETALHTAAWFPYVPVMEALLNVAGVNVHAKDILGRTPLFVAAASGDLDIVKLLLEAGASISEQDSYNGTPLLAAVRRGHINVVKYIISEFPEEIGKCDIFGKTAVDGALTYGPKSLVEMVNRDVHGQPILESIPSTYPARLGDIENSYCDVCVRPLKRDGYGRQFRCFLCLDADFYACDFCVGNLKAAKRNLCLDEEHANIETAWIY